MTCGRSAVVREGDVAQALRTRRDEVLARAFAAEERYEYTTADLIFGVAKQLDRELAMVLASESSS